MNRLFHESAKSMHSCKHLSCFLIFLSAHFCVSLRMVICRSTIDVETCGGIDTSVNEQHVFVAKLMLVEELGGVGSNVGVCCQKC